MLKSGTVRSPDLMADSSGHLDIATEVLVPPFRAGDRTPRLNVPGEAYPSEVLARLHYTDRRDLAFWDERRQADAVLLKNPDAVLRAKVPLTLGQRWPGFLYADMGATESTWKWQGLAGVRGAHEVDLIGGWRHVTYRFSPGRGFDSLDFNGPFLGATRAW